MRDPVPPTHLATLSPLICRPGLPRRSPGSAGTGKSFLLNHIINGLRAKFGESFHTRVAITASTGIAATHIGGTTLHSMSGVGYLQRKADFGRCWQKPKAAMWRELDVLLIDEISMISGEFIELLHRVLQNIRGHSGVPSTAPFGGVQLVFTGDFFQLPNIVNRISAREAFGNRGYAFQAPSWMSGALNLTQVSQGNICAVNEWLTRH